MRLQIVANILPLEGDSYQDNPFDTAIAPFRWMDLSDSVDVKMTTGPHGFESLSGFWPAFGELAEAFFLGMSTMTVYLKAGPYTVWKGRMEDMSHRPDGVKWTAYGPFRYFSDKIITRVFSTQDISGLVQATEDEISDHVPHSFVFDKNDRIFIGLKKNTQYVNGDSGGWIYYAPHLKDTIKRVLIDYDVVVPNSNWHAHVYSYAEGFTSETVEWTQAGTGSGSTTITLSTARPIIVFQLENHAAGTVNYTGESGAAYAKWTDVRLLDLDSTQSPADTIVGEIIDEVYALNTPPRISDSKSFVPITGRDLPESVWIDVKADDVIRDLAATVDGTGPPYDQFFARMWGDYLIFGNAPGHWVPWDSSYFEDRPTWFVDVEGSSYERSISTLINYVYGTYRSPTNKRVLRTTAVEDTDSQEQYGIIREDFVRENTTDSTDASTNADKLLENLATPPYRVTLDIERVTIEGGAPVPPWMVWAGDRVIVRNGIKIPSIASDDVLILTVSRTDLSLDNMELRITPEAGALTMPMSLARRRLSVGKEQRYQNVNIRPYR